jgi:hypothetical protein
VCRGAYQAIPARTGYFLIVETQKMEPDMRHLRIERDDGTQLDIITNDPQRTACIALRRTCRTDPVCA